MGWLGGRGGRQGACCEQGRKKGTHCEEGTQAGEADGEVREGAWGRY